MSDESALDRGLKQIFGTGKLGSSILKRIASRRGSVPQVHLREIADGPTPVVKPGAQGATPGERYQIIGEIARGGVGLVLKGRDVDLGRDVAMKVLLDEHADRAELIERFVEEAQVGGQLQHPGIVPVYEIGLQEDGRPFFAMKLVKGETLSALLLKRRSPRESRRKYLSIFEQVCHTMAYAHARGVIHRDLKPSNIMVGNFGEVMVVDWGFAKILASGGNADEERTLVDRSIIETERSGGGSESIAGSVLGTPGYMPPEQARGERDLLDERADVFALGSIFCEILTGKPAFADGDLIGMAWRGELEPAFSRLDESGADEALVGLVKECLSVDPRARPASAEHLATRVGAYLTSVEERAQAAKVEAAEARVREQGAKRARRLTVALAASVLLAAGGFYWQEQRGRELERIAEAEVDAALVAASAKLGAARAAAVGDLSLWPAALDAARRADAMAQGRGAGEGKTSAFLASTLAEQQQAERATASLAADSRAVRELAAARLMRGEEFKDVPAVFEREFNAIGIDVRAMSTDELVAAVRDSAIEDDLRGALDGWAALLGTDDVEIRSRIREAVRRLDPDPWRTKLRLIDDAGDDVALRVLRQSINIY